ncbi:MAG: recombinase family protein [Blautia sp.]|nr:recombinase family protein [Blautia sp.]MCM1200619.1 recombinase family protein [Bacteroides fragilis]
MKNEASHHYTKLRVAAYCRVSTDKDDQTNSLISQRRYFADYINQHEDWVLNDVYYDEGISGTQTKKRAGFNAMIEEAMQGGIDLILTKEVCRFARNTVDTLSYTRKLKDKGIGVVFTIDNIDTRDADGELRLTIMASIAQEESRKTSERVKWGQKRRMEQGVVFGRDMLGYTVQNGGLSVNEEEIPIVCAIFHKFTNEGKGTHVIARELMEEGMRPVRVKLWSNTIILRVLRNEKYVGDLCQKKTYTPNYLTHAKKYNRGNEEMIYLKDHHEPIISRELWNRTQAELLRRSPSEDIRSKHSNRYWCSGKLCCGLCGQRYVSRTKKLKNGTIYKAWRCYAAAGHGTKKMTSFGDEIGCDNGSVNEKTLLTCMYYCICQLQTNQKELKREITQEIREIKGITGKKPDTKRIQAKMDALAARKRKAIDLMVDGLITRSDLQEQTKWYDEQLAALSESLNAAGRQDKINAAESHEYESYLSALDEIISFDESNESLYREILDKMIIYHDKTVEVWLKNVPFGMKLAICSHGKNDDYHTDILSMEIIEKS